MKYLSNIRSHFALFAIALASVLGLVMLAAVFQPSPMETGRVTGPQAVATAIDIAHLSYEGKAHADACQTAITTATPGYGGTCTPTPTPTNTPTNTFTPSPTAPPSFTYTKTPTASPAPGQLTDANKLQQSMEFSMRRFGFGASVFTYTIASNSWFPYSASSTAGTGTATPTPGVGTGTNTATPTPLPPKAVYEIRVPDSDVGNNIGTSGDEVWLWVGTAVFLESQTFAQAATQAQTYAVQFKKLGSNGSTDYKAVITFEHPIDFKSYYWGLYKRNANVFTKLTANIYVDTKPN